MASGPTGSGAPPKVSIITAAYNSASTIEATVASVLGQTFDDWEMVVADDGSSDGTAQAVERAAGGDPRVRVVKRPNGGPAAARNTAIAASTGEFLCILDADDRYLPAYLENMAAFIAQNPGIDLYSLHTHLIGSDIVGRLAARSAGVPVLVSTQHDLYRRAPIWGLYRRWTAGWIDAQIANAQAVAPYCESELHLDPSRIHVIENGIDSGRFESVAAMRRREPVFGTLGTLIPVKDQATAVRALARLRESLPQARLILAGTGPELPRLERLADGLGVADAVEFPGVVDAPGMLEQVTALVHPSLQEAFGLAVVEAMAAGRTVIASDLPSLRGLLDDGAAGVLVPVGDDVAFADAMLRVATEHEWADTLAAAGRVRALERYSARRMADEHAALYRRLVAAANGAPPTGAGEHR